MEIKTFRAKTMQQALNLVRSELGPEATVLHTRELNASLVKRMLLGRQYEIAATPGQQARQSRETEQCIEQPAAIAQAESRTQLEPRTLSEKTTPELGDNYRERSRQAVQQELSANRAAVAKDPLAELQSIVDEYREQSTEVSSEDVSVGELPGDLFGLYTDLIEVEIQEEIARDLVEQLRGEQLRPGVSTARRSPLALRARAAQMIEAELTVTGPIELESSDARIVALVGPTGVGKTTTIAKLAANYRLRDNKRVALVTVDTYRIAAVEQLRTYADIIDLPMEVVGTPAEMRSAIEKFRDFDLILMDTAGRSPRDELRIQELQSLLGEAHPDEVHLVLSSVGSARSLTATAERFAPVGVNSLLVTKLDEATSLGNLLTLARESRLPFSYLTHGQDVPDDIRVAQRRRLAHAILGIHA